MNRASLAAALSLSLSLVTLSARADGPDGPPPEPPVKATIFPLPHPDVSEETVVAVMRSLEAGLKKNPRIDFHDLDQRVAEFAQEIPQDQVEAARTASKDGQKALLDLNIPLATQKLQDAVSGLAKVLPYIKKQELADAMGYLAVALYENGDAKGGREQLVRLLTWRSDYVFDPAKMPPAYLEKFTAVQAEIEKAKRGSIMITSDPNGAQAYVDGKYVGVTPCTAEGLIIGEHYVTFKKEGYKKTVTAAQVSAKRELKASSTLDRSEKYLLVEQAIKKVSGTLGADIADPDVDNLKQVLFIDHGIFLRATAKPGDKVELDTFLYDLRTRRRLSRVTNTVSRTQVEGQLGNLASTLYLNVSYDPELVVPKDRPKPKQLVRTPLYKTWWFWLATVGGAAVLGGAIATVVSVLPATCPDGNFCFHLTQ